MFVNKQLFQSHVIPDDVHVIFVADLFADEYVGGAELTSQALIDTCPFKIHCIKSKDVTMALLEKGVDKFWVFGNFAQLNPQLIPAIVANLKYSVLEYDYKYCRFRSPEKHEASTGTSCDCHEQMNGKIVSAFYYGAMGLWWMSEAQKERYLRIFPFLVDKDNVVLSSVFDARTLGFLKALRIAREKGGDDRKCWIVLGSDSWIKGSDDAEQWCKDTNKSYEVLRDLPYEVLLDKMSRAEGFAYLPKGADTCPRMVIEAKLLGCKLHINDNVQHAKEEWFVDDNLTSIEEYLYAAPKLFWEGTKIMMDYKPRISGYTTTYNCVSQGYPFLQSIKSMLQFCDEVCIVDGGSTDGTIHKLLELADELNKLDGTFHELDLKPGAQYDDDWNINSIRGKRIKINVIRRDWSHPHHAVFDGMQKAEARAMCTGDFCWQMDSDEVVHEDDIKRIYDICCKLPREVDILSLPVIEYWGGPEKVRVDVQPWKWRLSRNKPHITHGIPVSLRKKDEHGEYAAVGTDGCDMIDKETGVVLPHVSFYVPEIEQVRVAALSGNQSALEQYEKWFNAVVSQLPSVFHYSWYDLPRKIRLYRDYWQNHWNGLWGKNTDDTSENNMMFDVPWKDVTDEMLLARADEMKNKLGGWIWHRKWDGKTTTPHIRCMRTQPKIMQPVDK